MKVGKVSNELLEKIVFNKIFNKRDEVYIRASIGEDTSVLDFGSDYIVVSCDPITGATKGLGKLAVHISCNDIATSGAEPVGLLVTILMPENSKEEELEEIMDELGEECKKLNVEIIGGHTEVTKVVNQTVLVCTVLGKIEPSKLPRKEKVNAGDKVLITKGISIEGTSIIAKEKYDELKDKLSTEELEEAINLSDSLSVVKEGLLATEFNVKYMHDITEGGVLGALWETGIAIGKGITIDKSKIPVYKITEKIGDIYNIDIYKLISSGSMILVMDPENASRYQAELEKKNLKVSVIGEVTDNNSIKLLENNISIEIESPESDELYKVINQ